MNPVELLAQILNNNIGNRLTVELASGIVAVFNQVSLQQAEKMEQSNEQSTDRQQGGASSC